MSVRRSLVWLTALVLALLLIPAPAALASDSFAQGDSTEEETEGQEGSDPEGEGQSDPETETDPGEGGEAAEEESGPVWTYQMAWLALGGLALLGLATILMYWRLVVVRGRAGS